ncbi:hypothetical protein ACFFHM_06230 [Halalkalibacter kiskunsagensis]|uniref:Uncharacterized protein n=1 Tax=Halalkalibacter kiskunsagensis TaxID=1548599 RepID=A0ABV6K9Z2_9BACI
MSEWTEEEAVPFMKQGGGSCVFLMKRGKKFVLLLAGPVPGTRA